MLKIPDCKLPDKKHTFKWINYPMSKIHECIYCGYMKDVELKEENDLK